jgi:hypothetical protein
LSTCSENVSSIDFKVCFLLLFNFFEEFSVSNDCPFASSPNDIRSIKFVSFSKLNKLDELLSDANTVSAKFVLNRWRLKKTKGKRIKKYIF